MTEITSRLELIGLNHYSGLFCVAGSYAVGMGKPNGDIDGAVLLFGEDYWMFQAMQTQIDEVVEDLGLTSNIKVINQDSLLLHDRQWQIFTLTALMMLISGQDVIGECQFERVSPFIGKIRAYDKALQEFLSELYVYNDETSLPKYQLHLEIALHRSKERDS